jgi:hypothetical protein
MATPKAGRNGRLYMDITAGGTGSASAIPLVAKWNTDRTSEEFDGTSFGDTSKVKIAGLPGGDISFEGFMDPTDVGIVGIMGDGIQTRKVYLYTNENRSIAYFFTTGSVSGTVDDDVNGLLKITGKVSNSTSLIFVP